MDKFASLIEQLARVVGVQVERLWPDVIRVYFFTTLIEVLMWPIVFVVVGLVARKTIRHGVEMKNDGYGMWPANKCFVLIPTYVVLAASAILLLIYLLTLPGNLGILYRPEASYVMHQLGK